MNMTFGQQLPSYERAGKWCRGTADTVSENNSHPRKLAMSDSSAGT